MNERSNKQKIILGIQHTLAMFGATVLVPAITGLNTSITLLCAGIGTLMFHYVTKKKVPVFLGSSFAFMGGITAVLGTTSEQALMTSEEFLGRLASVKGALIVSGLVYVLFSVLIKIFGYEKVNKILPPIVTGPIIIVIGLRLASTAISSAFYDVSSGEFSWKYVLITAIVLATIIGISVFAKGLFNLMPILFAIIVGYLVCLAFGLCNFDNVSAAHWISFTDSNIVNQLLCIPKFDLDSILAIAPIALVTVIEHVGDITTNSAVVGKNFMIDPGIHRTILGDGLATAFAGLIGGPANTTYGENTGVLAVTKVYDPAVIRIAAVLAIVLGVIGKFGAFVSGIPAVVTGAIGIVLYGMISAVGVRILINAKINLGNSRNLIISAIILVLGIGCDSIPVSNTVTISGLAIAAVLGIVLALILPSGQDDVIES